VISRGHRIGTAEGRVTDDKKRSLAHGTTTCLILKSDNGAKRDDFIGNPA
jgi:acyl-coenzyme A thioesterase PaaI-like protein